MRKVDEWLQLYGIATSHSAKSRKSAPESQSLGLNKERKRWLQTLIASREILDLVRVVFTKPTQPHSLRHDHVTMLIHRPGIRRADSSESHDNRLDGDSITCLHASLLTLPIPGLPLAAREAVLTMSPPTDLQTVLDSEIKEWHFHIYFHQHNAEEHHAALELRDAVLRLRRDGAFVAVPLFRVNLSPIGPHPVGYSGSYEIWCPSESFASVFSYLCINRGELRATSVLVHPLTREERKDHDTRKAWIGPSFPLDLSTLPVESETVPLQYASLKVGYSSNTPTLSLEQRKKIGASIENTLKNEKEAAKAPPTD
ncbi:hypothetical protein EVG20_g3556 [Dentipellis fragilis]|uniref:DOPA 4,5-dioxygenase n=1 Tax=Dentipellis fragilis TaxID=205917 RepID=A0A4Y9Z518_9AGAM|nr:hypothetical protein EVG20_g3556 [Dentipellis fragilis]